MTDETRYGHRQRMRDSYENSGAKSMSDEKLLEFYLSQIIPQKDVRSTAYDLIRHFGSLEGVWNASVPQLMQVNGVGKKTALMITLSHDINARIKLNQARSIVRLDSTDKAMDYVESLISDEPYENFVVIALDNSNKVLAHRIFTSSGVNFSDANPRSIMGFVLDAKASNVVVGHNHPGGDSQASSADYNFTIMLRDLLAQIDVNLLDHVIVGADGRQSLKQDEFSREFFYTRRNYEGNVT